MDGTALTRDVQQLRADLDQERRERLALKATVEQLRTKLLYPGTKFLVELEFRVIFEGRILVALNSTRADLIDTLPGELHALYQVSAYSVSNTPMVLTDGALSSYPALSPPLAEGVSVCLQRQRQSAPVRTEVSLRLVNASATMNANIAVKVWRRLGMGS